jgi:protein TonB
MSEFLAPAQSPVAARSAFEKSARTYLLSDDLAKLCLPQEWKDSYRTLAWVNSICLFFLLVGLVGLKPPKVIHRPLSELVDVVPVIFTPPEEPPTTEPESKPDESQPQDTPADTPQVVTVVAAADPSSVAFSVPVQGAVAVAVADAVHLATPPPPVNQAPPRAVQFNPNVSDGGSYPPPSYPGAALRNHYAGTVTIEIMVDASGAILEAKAFKSSGYTVLDEAALDIVKRRWRFPPGLPRLYHWPCIFQF